MPTDPVCGMHVDERTSSLLLVRDNRTYYFCSQACRESFTAPEVAELRTARRLGVAVPLAAGATVLTYLAHPAVVLYIAAVLAAAVQFYSGWDFYVGAVDSIRSRIANMDVLIAVGTSAAFGYSLVALAFPGALKGGVFFDASTLIITLILTGNLLEQRTRRHAGSSLRDLDQLLPREALRVEGGSSRSVPREDIRVGDRLRVLPGGIVPADGIVLEGRSELDEALWTGESLPVPKGPGETVIAGARNGTGSLDIEARSIGPDSFVAQIAELLSDAEASRIPLRRLADRIASVFVPVVLTLAIAAALGWTLLAGASLATGVLIFVSVVIIACPCAFGIATPAAILVGTGRAAEEGILFRGGDSIERTARVNLVVSDKTGTLTSDVPSVASTWVAPGRLRSELLALSAGLEAHSEHVYARAVLEMARSEAIAPASVEDVRAVPGAGVEGTIAGRHLSLRSEGSGGPGSDSLQAARGSIDAAVARGESWSALWEDGQLVGVLSFATPLRPGSIEAVRELAELGIPLQIVTGDRAEAAAQVARTLGVSVARARASPEEKLAYLREQRASGKSVAFVGDGINDAAALAGADVGIAIGTGTEIARDSGQVLLVRPDLRGVPRAIRLSRAVVGKVRGNLTWAIGYNAVLLPIAAGALVPFLGFGVYTVLPIAGAIAMAISSTTVLLNSLSLRRVLRPRARARGFPLPGGSAPS